MKPFFNEITIQGLKSSYFQKFLKCYIFKIKTQIYFKTHFTLSPHLPLSPMFFPFYSRFSPLHPFFHCRPFHHSATPTANLITSKTTFTSSIILDHQFLVKQPTFSSWPNNLLALPPPRLSSSSTYMVDFNLFFAQGSFGQPKINQSTSSSIESS